MVAKPMQGDGPIFEDDPPVTLEEIIATCEDDHNLLLALAMARAWPEGLPEAQLEPWQRIGPDVLWMVCRQDLARYTKIHAESVNYLSKIGWIYRQKITRKQMARAASGAIYKLVYRRVESPKAASKEVSIREATYLDLRAEATAFLVNCMSVAQFGVEIALGMRPDARTPSRMA